MEGFAALLLGLGMMTAAHDAAYAPYRAGYPYDYATPSVQADAAYRPAYVYIPAPSPLPAMGAVTGGLIGAAGAGAPGLVLGATFGGLMGDAMSMPQVVHVAPAGAGSAYAPAPSAHSARSTDHYLQRWEGFMEPVARR
jgi:hypothetical protein